MTRTTFKMHDKLIPEFYQIVLQKFDRRRGSVEMALNEAIELWISKNRKKGKSPSAPE